MKRVLKYLASSILIVMATLGICGIIFKLVYPVSDLSNKEVVRVSVPNSNGYGTGFGFLHKGKKFIISAAHVCKGSDLMIVDFSHSSKVLYTNELHDICIIEYPEGLLTEVYKPMIHLDYPHRYMRLKSKGFQGTNPLTPITHQQKIMFTHTTFLGNNLTKYIHTEGLLIPGNSGGPLLNKFTNRVLGVASLSEYQKGKSHVAYYVRVEHVLDVLDAFLAGKSPPTESEYISMLDHTPFIWNKTKFPINEDDQKAFNGAKIGCWRNSRRALTHFEKTGNLAHQALCGGYK